MSVSSPSGAQALWSSVNDWLAANVPASSTPTFTYGFDQALAPAVMPRVDVSAFNLPDPGDTALGAVIFTNNPAGHIQGKLNKAMLELNIRADGSQQANALQVVRQLRDLFVYALTNAGCVSEATNALIMPPIISPTKL